MRRRVIEGRGMTAVLIALIMLPILSGCQSESQQAYRNDYASSREEIVTDAEDYPVATAPTTPPIVNPRLNLGCPSNDAGEWAWYTANFGASWQPTSSPIVEWGIDYGDGKRYVATQETDAVSNTYWHKYVNDGSFIVRAWLRALDGGYTERSCGFNLTFWRRTYGTRCADGWLSPSYGSGTCSWHGGIAG